MISKCSSKIVMYLIGSGAIAEEDAELYAYGFFVLLSHLFFFCITVLWGILFGILLENVLLFFLFTPLRGYAGGFHSTSEHRCTVYTITALFLASIGIKLLQVISRPIVAITVLITGALIVFLLSPLDSPAKPLSEGEHRHYKKITRTIIAVICLLSLGCAVFREYAVLHASSLCMILESILLLLGKLPRNYSVKKSAI